MYNFKIYINCPGKLDSQNLLESCIIHYSQQTDMQTKREVQHK